MKVYTISVSDETSEFYKKIAENVGLPVEQVLADALFKLAGELSMEAFRNKKREE